MLLDSNHSSTSLVLIELSYYTLTLSSLNDILIIYNNMNIRGDILFFSDYPIIGLEKELPLYVLNIGLQHCQDHIIRKEGYPFPQFLYCTKGSGTLLYDDEKYTISAFTGIFLPAHYPHEYFANEEVWDIHWVVPDGNALASMLSHFKLTQPTVCKLVDVSKLNTLFHSIHETLRADNLYGNYSASGYLYQFIIEFNRNLIQKSNVQMASHSALMKALRYIDDHYTEAITMDDLCATSHVTKQHLCLLFRNTLHTRPMEYIAKRRVQTAKELLIGTTQTLEEIAESTGFCTTSYFCKLFKKYVGLTPTQFRNER